MFGTFFSFEIKHWLRAPLPWIFMFIFGLMIFGATVSNNITIGGSIGNVWKNAPFVVQQYYAVMSIMSLLLVTAFFNNAALRDFEHNTAQFVFSAPISKAGYYFGHFLGALLASLIPMFGISLGIWIGTGINGVFHWIDAERFGPFEWQSHWNAYCVFVIPNMIFAGGILYTVATLTRNTVYTFLAAIALLVAYLVGGNLIRELDNEQLGTLLDPFGIRAFSIMTKYWTVEDKNVQSISLYNIGMLTNRLLWMAVGLLVLVIGYVQFDFSEQSRGGNRKKKNTVLPLVAVSARVLPRITPSNGLNTTLRQFFSQFRTETLGIVRSIPFFLLAFLGLLNCVPNMFTSGEAYGTHNLPVTYQMVGLIRGSYYLFVISIMCYFSGALIWKERNARISDIYDALPTKNWTGYLSKFLAVMVVIALLSLVAIVAGVIGQTAQGYTRYELGVYVRELLVLDLLRFAMLTAMFMLVHVLSPNMYLGFFIGVSLLIVNSFIWPMLHIESNMIIFSSTPSYKLSDFYGYLPYAPALTWFNVYWALFCSILTVAAICFWPRGRDNHWRKRLQLATSEWRNYRWVGLGALGAWMLSAGFVWYNTYALNTHVTGNEQEKIQVRYETSYRQRWLDAQQPRIYKVAYDIRLFPEKRAVEADGEFWVRNTHQAAIDTLFVQVPGRLRFALQNERLQLALDDSLVRVRLYRIQPALAPGDSMLLRFSSVFRPKGFENELLLEQVMQNGTFFNNTEIAPMFGYQPRSELTDKNKRKKYGLAEKSRAPALNPADTLNRRNNYLTNDADWVSVKTIISTSVDQIAIAPGSLRREWTDQGRRYYHYELDHKAWNFYAFMSARYAVARRNWNGIDLEVYYHPEHDKNVERMLTAMQRSLEYYTTHFGPYYHKQCRIIEFPRIAEFAQAFPGTMPYSEGAGFIEDFKAEKDDIDMVFYIVAHEMGHQWWAHQECGAAMQGGEMLTETLAQYSALMVMEKEYGRDILRKFLTHETDRYLRGRGLESLKELPLAKCENQGYVHYRKGSAVMYYLKEMIGAEKVNTALKTFLERYRYAEAPYPVSTDLVNEFAAQTPDSLRYIIDDLFWNITLFENSAKDAIVQDLGNNQWKVILKTNSRKLRADERGKETDIAINDWIEIGAFAKPEGDKKYGKTLHRERVRISQRDNIFSFIVNEKPDKVGIDPFSLLIDRNPKDNLKDL